MAAAPEVHLRPDLGPVYQLLGGGEQAVVRMDPDFGPMASSVLLAEDLSARVEPDVAGQPGVVLSDRMLCVELTERLSDRARVAKQLEAVAAVLLARAAELRKPPIPERPRPGDLGVPAHWT